MKKIIIYTDGASRGNPGPASIGVVICDKNERTLKEYYQSLGNATNNEAEYQAVIFALKKLKALFGKTKIKEYEIEMRSDSQLLVNQLTGKYKIVNLKIQQLFLEAWNLKVDIGNISFSYIPREKNKKADALANKALDSDGVAKRLF